MFNVEMTDCAVKGCLKKNKKNSVYYHLPDDTVRRKLWLDACDIRYYDKFTMICSLHFRNSDFYIHRIKNGKSFVFKKLLKNSAIPNIDNIVKHNKIRSRIQKREVRSYVLATQRRCSVTANLDKYSLRTLSNLALASCRYNSALLYKICEKEGEISELKEQINKWRKKHLKMKIKYQNWKKIALRRMFEIY